MKKIVLLAAAVAMLAAMALPAGAHSLDVGTFQGLATVGKSGECPQSGDGSASGEGLGLPVVNGIKTGFWTLETTVEGIVHGTGQLVACGQLGPVLGLVGASCGISEGHSGKGSLVSATESIGLTNLGWATSAGGTLPVVGNTTDHGTKDKIGTVIALTQAQGGIDCTTKQGSGDVKTGGATEFTVVGVAALLPVPAPKA